MLRFIKQLTGGSRRRPHGNKTQAGMESLEQRVVLTSMAGLGLTAASAVVIDANGNPVGELNLSYQNAMASTTKIMTALIAIEAAQNTAETGISLDDTVTVGFYPTTVGGSTSNPGMGEQFVLRDLLTMSLLSSDNEITQTIAEYIVGQASNSVVTGVAINNQFVAMMNNRAAELGLSDTSFRNPHGRDPEDLPELGTAPGPNRGHFSTAVDMARLGQFAMQNEVFAEIAGTVSDSVTSTRPDGTTAFYNAGTTNGLLLTGTASAYPGAEGVKGGLTDRAGFVLVSQATLLGKTMNATVMDSDSWLDRNLDTHKALNFGFQEKFGWAVDEIAFTVDTRTGFYDISTGVYTITGSDSVDNVQIWRYSDDMMVQVNGITEWLPIDDLTEIHIDTRGGDDYVRISGTPESLTIDIDAGAGNDTIVIGTGVGLDPVDTPLYVVGGTGADTLQFNDSGANRAQTYLLRDGGVMRSGETISEYTGIESIRLDGTGYNDFIELNGVRNAVGLDIHGGHGLDTLVADDQRNTWIVESHNRGRLNDDRFRDVENLTGGSSMDIFSFAGQAGISGSVDGGAGIDELDYSQYDSGVTVDLAAATAGNIGGRVYSIENITGSMHRDKLLGNSENNVLKGLLGDDLLVGRGGKDHLINKAGHSVMIGGLGDDILEGGADDELMIAAATSFDGSLDALSGILSQWTNTKLSVPDRMRALASGFQVGHEFVRLDSHTVKDEERLDALFGNGGVDWLWSAEEDRNTTTIASRTSK